MEANLFDFKINQHSLKTPIKGKSETVTYTQVKSFKAQIDNHIIKGEIPLFPMFYKTDQTSLFEGQKLQINLNQIDFTKKFFNLIKDTDYPVNEVFAIEQFLLSYLCVIEHKSLLNIFKNSTSCRFNDLYHESIKRTPRTIKFKIGRLEPELENETLSKLCKQQNLIRLDGNQMLTPEQLSRILKDIDLRYIQYIEEPFTSIAKWNQFLCDYKEFSKLNFALDENYRSYYNKLDQIKNLSAIIIKPSRDLSISGLLAIKNDLTDYDIVISSSFEPELSLNTMIYLGAMFDTHHGLGTYTYLNDPINEIKIDEDKQVMTAYPLKNNQVL